MPDGRPFLAVRLVRGRTLATVFKDGAADRGTLVGVFEDLCQAVGYAHSKEVLHRDLKPANVMVGAFGEVQVMDWGLAKVLTVSREAESSEPSADPEATTDADALYDERHPADATRVGDVLGTPAYMAPEQASGAAVDRRTDVFGLGRCCVPC